MCYFLRFHGSAAQLGGCSTPAAAGPTAKPRAAKAAPRSAAAQARGGAAVEAQWRAVGLGDLGEAGVQARCLHRPPRRVVGVRGDGRRGARRGTSVAAQPPHSQSRHNKPRTASSKHGGPSHQHAPNQPVVKRCAVRPCAVLARGASRRGRSGCRGAVAATVIRSVSPGGRVAQPRRRRARGRRRHGRRRPDRHREPCGTRWRPATPTAAAANLAPTARARRG